MPAAGYTPSQPYTGFNSQSGVRVVLQFAADREPEGIGRADFVLKKSAVQIVGPRRWRERDGGSRRRPGLAHPIAQPPNYIVAIPRGNMMLEVEIKHPQHLRHSHIGAAIGIEIRLEGRDRKSTRLNSSHLVISYAV